MKSELSTYATIMTTKKNPRKNSMYNPSGNVTKVTIHHMAGNQGADACAKMHALSKYQQSANYYIGSDGKIVCGVDEEFRAWTSGSKANDYQAITIEVANNTGAPNWTISDAAYKSLIKLCKDICSRYHIEPSFTGDSKGSFTFHYMFQATECPGPYIKKNIYRIIDDVKGFHQTNQSTTTHEPASSFLVKVTVTDLNIRSGPGTKYKRVGHITDQGTYTIVEKSGKWGKLKSGAGWIYLGYTREV